MTTTANTSLHATLLCRHCDRTFGVQTDDVDLSGVRKLAGIYDISRWHECPEGKTARKRVAIMLSAPDRLCKYACKRPCSHPYPEKEEAM